MCSPTDVNVNSVCHQHAKNITIFFLFVSYILLAISYPLGFVSYLFKCSNGWFISYFSYRPQRAAWKICKISKHQLVLLFSWLADLCPLVIVSSTLFWWFVQMLLSFHAALMSCGIPTIWSYQLKLQCLTEEDELLENIYWIFQCLLYCMQSMCMLYRGHRKVRRILQNRSSTALLISSVPFISPWWYL